MPDKKLLALRNKIKKRQPGFVVKESNFSARIKKRWRFPHGRHSKVRQMHHGRPKLPSIGYSGPKEIRGLDRSGFEPVLVHNLKELLSLNPTVQGAVLAKIGMKKGLAVLKAAVEKKIKVLNVRKIEQRIKEMEDSFISRKKAKTEKSSAKTRKEEEKKKKAEEKLKKVKEEKEEKEKKVETQPEEEKLNEQEEKIEEQKKAVEKTLIKKQ